MMLPVHAWGQVYHLVPIATRLKGDFIRVFAGAENTTISINGTVDRTLPQKGGKEGDAWFTLLEHDRRLLEFTADKPIYVAQYNNSFSYDDMVGDPFMLVLTPLEQYQTSFTFSTPGYDYPTNFINLVIDSSDWNNIEIAPGGTEDWKKLSVETGAIPQNFPTLIDGVRYAGVTFEIAPGVYRLRGTRPSAGYIYGWSRSDSYGYPLSVTVANLDAEARSSVAPRNVDLPGLTLGPVAPTPTDGRASLAYQVPSASNVEIILIDATGRTVATLLEKSPVAAGSHTLRFDLSALPSGTYFCRMSVGEKLLVQPLVVR